MNVVGRMTSFQLVMILSPTSHVIWTSDAMLILISGSVFLSKLDPTLRIDVKKLRIYVTQC